MPIAGNSRVVSDALWRVLNQSLESQPANDAVVRVKSALKKHGVLFEQNIQSCLHAYLGGECKLPEGIQKAIQQVTTTRSATTKEDEAKAVDAIQSEITAKWQDGFYLGHKNNSFFDKPPLRMDIDQHVEHVFLNYQDSHEKIKKQLKDELTQIISDFPEFWQTIKAELSSKENKSNDISVDVILDALMARETARLLKIGYHAKTAALVTTVLRKRRPEDKKVREFLNCLYLQLYQDHGVLMRKYLPCLKHSKDSQLDQSKLLEVAVLVKQFKEKGIQIPLSQILFKVFNKGMLIPELPHVIFDKFIEVCYLVLRSIDRKSQTHRMTAVEVNLTDEYLDEIFRSGVSLSGEALVTYVADGKHAVTICGCQYGNDPYTSCAR